ncbi:MAG: LysR family transcriptional regulator [Mobilitalea sp.]
MEINILEYFYSIAEGSTFFTTAERHSISQSSLSKSIRKLEDEIGVQLLDRSRRSVVLTPAGQSLQQDLKTFLPQYYEMMQHMRYYSNPKEINICGIPSYTVFGLRQCLNSFSNLHPEIKLNLLHESDSKKVEELLKNGEVDFAFMHQPFQNQNYCNITHLYDDTLIAILPLQHRLAEMISIPLSELQDEMLFANPWSNSIVRDAFEAVGLVPKVMNTNLKREDLFHNTVRGQSCSLFYQSDLSLYNLSTVAARNIQDFPKTPFVMASPKNLKLNEALDTFKKYILFSLSDNSYMVI